MGLCHDRGRPYRFLIECKHWNKPLQQQLLLAFAAVVDDLGGADAGVHGVFVTKTGYQAGALRVADAHGIAVTELRVPTERDWDGRVREIVYTIQMCTPQIEDIGVYFVTEPAGGFASALDRFDFTAVLQNGQPFDLRAALLGEEGSALAAREPIPVRRVFTPPLNAYVNGKPLGQVNLATASVGVTVTEETVTIDGRDRIDLLLTETLGGRTAVIDKDGRLREVGPNPTPARRPSTRPTHLDLSGPGHLTVAGRELAAGDVPDVLRGVLVDGLTRGDQRRGGHEVRDDERHAFDHGVAVDVPVVVTLAALDGAPQLRVVPWQQQQLLVRHGHDVLHTWMVAAHGVEDRVNEDLHGRPTRQLLSIRHGKRFPTIARLLRQPRRDRGRPGPLQHPRRLRCRRHPPPIHEHPRALGGRHVPDAEGGHVLDRIEDQAAQEPLGVRDGSSHVEAPPGVAEDAAQPRRLLDRHADQSLVTRMVEADCDLVGLVGRKRSVASTF